MVKEDTVYSIPWKPVNRIAKIKVAINPYKLPFLLPWIIEWCAYVTVTPEDNSNTVFNKGNSNGFMACIPNGGHCAPSSMVGDNALWKKAQNIAKKNSASDIINSPTPIFIPLCTARVWLPLYVASDITSLNQKDILKITAIKEKYKQSIILLKLWKDNAALKVKDKSAVLV